MTDKPPARPTETRDPKKARQTMAPAIDFTSLANQQTPNYLSPGARKEKLRQRNYTPTPPPGPGVLGSWGPETPIPDKTSRPQDLKTSRPQSDVGAALAAARGRGQAPPLHDSRSIAQDSSTPLPYVELHAASAFSFLDGASLPEDLIQRACDLDLGAIALLDRNGVYGAPRFYQAARQAGIKAIVGAEVVVGFTPTPPGPGVLGSWGPDTPPPTKTPRPQDLKTSRPSPEVRLSLLVCSRIGYRNLCRLLTHAARGRPKGEARVDWQDLEQHSAGLHCLTGGDGELLAHTLETGGADPARRVLQRLSHLFEGRVYVELQRHRLRHEEHRNQALVDLARRLDLPLVATNGVRYARDGDKRLHDILTCIRHHTHLDAAGQRLAANRERHLKGAAEMTQLFADHPEALIGSYELAQQLDFTLADLGYRFPNYPVPPGETSMSYLRHITWNSARSRFRPLTGRSKDQIEKELAMIDRLDLAGYFLIVWDIVQFCKREGILAQGRGSAANSAVCYALSITAVDPVKMELLFERFLSEERGEWPDIDLDLPSGDQREKVIQYVYKRYGPHGAAMTANVITYRDRSAAREVAKSLGYSTEQVNRLAKQLGTWRYDTSRGDPKSLSVELSSAGFDPEESRIRLFAEMWRKIQNLPRHLGQHSGGMVMAAGRLDEVVPLEPAAMENRVVVQWDKDDCADLGIIKVDLLGLGMLQALEEAIPFIRQHEKVAIDLAHLPPDDPDTFEMLRRADTVGVFQVESRAQMASLPRNAPTRFYDLVIQVAIIRPGPIVGGMVHPYFERRIGRQKVTYPHPSLKPILERTLGVLLFQEQILRVAMVAAGFSGGEAEELRRAMGFKRSAERMQNLEDKLRRGMTDKGIVGEAQEQVVHAITSFALYGFPESHAASFALIAYASAYLKAHHPTAFLIALLNAWPMGFYYPATLIKDAQRHGVEVRPIDVNHSGWRCRWEEGPGVLGSWGPEAIAQNKTSSPQDLKTSRPVGAARLGLRFVKGLRKEAGEAIEWARERRAFSSADDLVRRCRLRREELDVLAEIGALASLGSTRRAALWQVARAARPAGPLFEETRPGVLGSWGPGAKVANKTSRPQDLKTSITASLPRCPTAPLPEMSPYDETLSDYAGTGMTTGPHPLKHLRSSLDRQGVTLASDLHRVPNGKRVRTAGAVTVRQRPGTAKGILFLTLEDESGMSQAIVMPDLLQEQRQLIVRSPGLVVEGVLQKRDGTLSIKADKLWRLPDLAAAPSHDFR
ncbi:MAG: error-prone DNA polymerase [Thermoanaerobaculia bacterium]